MDRYFMPIALFYRMNVFVSLINLSKQKENPLYHEKLTCIEYIDKPIIASADHLSLCVMYGDCLSVEAFICLLGWCNLRIELQRSVFFHHLR